MYSGILVVDFQLICFYWRLIAPLYISRAKTICLYSPLFFQQTYTPSNPSGYVQCNHFKIYVPSHPVKNFLNFGFQPVKEKVIQYSPVFSYWLPVNPVWTYTLSLPHTARLALYIALENVYSIFSFNGFFLISCFNPLPLIYSFRVAPV